MAVAVVAFALLLMLAGLAMPRAALALTAGDVLRDRISIGGKQIPLPHGDWLIAGMQTQTVDLREIGAFGAIHNLVLFQSAGARVLAVLEINTNAISVNDGWGRTRACLPADPKITPARSPVSLYLVTRYRTGWETACYFVQVTHTGPTRSGPPAWDQARRRAAAEEMNLPTTWLTAGFRISDRQDLVDLRLHVAPALMGVEPDTNVDPDWSAAAVQASPGKRNAVQLLSGWAAGFEAEITRGLRNQQSAQPMEMPQLAPFLSAEPQRDDKLLALDALYHAGALTVREYQLQSRQALDEMPVLVDQDSALPLSVQKNLSFRLFGSSVDYILAYVVTLSNSLSAYITASIVTIHSVIFIGNDHFWENYWARRTTRDSERVVDFIYIGQLT